MDQMDKIMAIVVYMLAGGYVWIHIAGFYNTCNKWRNLISCIICGPIAWFMGLYDFLGCNKFLEKWRKWIQEEK